MLLLPCSLALVAAVVIGAPTMRDPGDRVAVVGDADDDAIAQQLRAELGTLGFEVVAAAPPADAGDGRALEHLADDLDVAAAMWVAEHEARVDIWVVDRVTGKTVRRTVQVPEGEADARIVALRAIELLRASLRELDDTPVLPEARVEPSSQVRELLRPRAPRFFVHVAPAVAGSPGGLGPSFHALLAFRYMPHPHFGLAVHALVPTVATQVDEREGTARVYTASVGAAAHASFVDPARRFQPDASLGVGPMFLRMQGSATVPYASATEVVTSATFFARTGLGIVVHPQLRLRIDGAVGVLLPRPVVRFAGRSVAHWGQPYALGALGLEVVIP